MEGECVGGGESVWRDGESDHSRFDVLEDHHKRTSSLKELSVSRIASRMTRALSDMLIMNSSLVLKHETQPVPRICLTCSMPLKKDKFDLYCVCVTHKPTKPPIELAPPIKKNAKKLKKKKTNDDEGEDGSHDDELDDNLDDESDDSHDDDESDDSDFDEFDDDDTSDIYKDV